MTYGRVLLLFVVPAIGAAAAWARPSRLGKRFAVSLAAMLAIVYVATVPWDNLAVKWGVWFFDWKKTWGVRLGYLPLEEYLFFGLETVLVALVYKALEQRFVDRASPSPPPDPGRTRGRRP